MNVLKSYPLLELGEDLNQADRDLSDYSPSAAIVRPPRSIKGQTIDTAGAHREEHLEGISARSRSFTSETRSINVLSCPVLASGVENHGPLKLTLEGPPRAKKMDSSINVPCLARVIRSVLY